MDDIKHLEFRTALHERMAVREQEEQDAFHAFQRWARSPGVKTSAELYHSVSDLANNLKREREKSARKLAKLEADAATDRGILIALAWHAVNRVPVPADLRKVCETMVRDVERTHFGGKKMQLVRTQ